MGWWGGVGSENGGVDGEGGVWWGGAASGQTNKQTNK
jgi:hypothetical protein